MASKKLMHIGTAVILIAGLVFWIGIVINHRMQQELCHINMLSLASCLHVYLNDYNNKFPTPHLWCDLLKDEAKTPLDDFKCPNAAAGPCTYALNRHASSYTFGTAPADLVFMFEAKPGWNQVGASELLTTEYHEGRGCHIMYADLSSVFVKQENIASLRWE